MTANDPEQTCRATNLWEVEKGEPMESYGVGFAQAYDARWSAFAKTVAPVIRNFYERAFPGGNRSLLDVCCGTGQLSLAFLTEGYRVTGIDISEHMLAHARKRAASFISEGKARFQCGDAQQFNLSDRFGIAVSTYDSLNHLPSESALEECFRCVLRACEDVFVFDLNTRHGLRRWNGTFVDDATDDLFLVTRGHYDGKGSQAKVRITGFIRTAHGNYERFDHAGFNTVFDLRRVREMLGDVGWRRVHAADVSDLATPVAEPEALARVFFVAYTQ